jgi:hypothetical protein
MKYPILVAFGPNKVLITFVMRWHFRSGRDVVEATIISCSSQIDALTMTLSTVPVSNLCDAQHKRVYLVDIFLLKD